MTITPSGRDPPTCAQFKHWLFAETKNDNKSTNPLGRAMRRVTAYQGNTVLEAGKFKIGGKLMFKIKRTTMIPLGGKDKGEYRKDAAAYEIPCEKWRAMRPPGSEDMHDCWWVRLQVCSLESPSPLPVDVCSNLRRISFVDTRIERTSTRRIIWRI